MILHPDKNGRVSFRNQTRKAPTQQQGPGTSAHNIFSELGIKPEAGCRCGERIRQMNAWGVQGCIANRETVISWWREAYHESTILERAKAGWHALSKSWFSLSDPFGSIFDEAMRRAASDQSNATDQRPIGMEVRAIELDRQIQKQMRQIEKAFTAGFDDWPKMPAKKK